MCQHDSEGIQYGCGHYVKTRNVGKVDCSSRDCALSSSHPSYCQSEHCNTLYGPDRSETITRFTAKWCTSCEQSYNPNQSGHYNPNHSGYQPKHHRY
ncbi:hypothetical protein Moror_11874 [Moniliophthora roreri MCA 2997]|uniref:Uncharacterized protein n=1 Tax=Moniliophthora roreri (strain MCA 2997) TaxID=1381753 RepID=V2Y662_MONRO|nr:hypothetical protein Moror_11874 [Moniliophthora roreri MCA 2997]